MPTMAWFRTWMYDQRNGRRELETECNTLKTNETGEEKSRKKNKGQRKKYNMLEERRTDQQRKTEKKEKKSETLKRL